MASSPLTRPRTSAGVSVKESAPCIAVNPAAPSPASSRKTNAGQNPAISEKQRMAAINPTEP